MSGPHLNGAATLLLLQRMAYVAGIADAVDHLRDTASVLHGGPGDRHRRSALRGSAQELDDQIGRQAQRRGDRAASSHLPTTDRSAS